MATKNILQLKNVHIFTQIRLNNIIMFKWCEGSRVVSDNENNQINQWTSEK